MERRKFISGVIGLAAAAAAAALGDNFKVAELKIADKPPDWDIVNDCLGADRDEKILRLAYPPIPDTMEQLDKEWAEDEAEQLAYEAWLRSKSKANPNSGRCSQCGGPLDDTRRSVVTCICAPCLGALSRISGNERDGSPTGLHAGTTDDWEQVIGAKIESTTKARKFIRVL